MLARRRTVDQTRHQHHADHYDRQGERHGAARPLLPEQPRQAGHEQDLKVAENGRHSCPDIGYGVGPQDQVDREKYPGKNRPEPLSQRPLPVPALLDDREHDQQRQRERGPVERRAHRARAGFSDEDRG
jgi:hypothetical protein